MIRSAIGIDRSGYDPIMLDFSSYHPITDTEARRLKEAEAAFLQGYREQMQGELAAAIERYRTSIETYPTAEAHTFLGWALAMQDRLDEAIEQCRLAIRIDPEFGNPYNDIGAYLMQRGETRAAEPWFFKALAAPRYECYHYAHTNLARAFELRFELQGALDHYRLALKDCPDYPAAIAGIHRVVAWLN